MAPSPFAEVEVQTMKRVFRALWAGWKRFAHGLGVVNRTILLTVFYFVIVDLINIVLRLTGLMLVASYEWMQGYGYDFIAVLHAITVIFTLLWLPFGKFFHIFQRPAQLGVAFYKDVGLASEQAACRRCGQEYTSHMHVEDLITVEGQLGYSYEMPGQDAGHYQRICPRCRRSILALAQGRLRDWDPGSGVESRRYM
jgi:ribosomal protein S27AE